MDKLAVIAIGGNSLIKTKGQVDLKSQLETVKETCHNIAELVEQGWNVAITHGNGPQVGFLIRRAELAAQELPLIPLEFAVADTQGAIGYMIQQSLINEFRRRGIRREPVTVVTQVVVDSNDPAFQNPSKPIGSFMTREEAERHKQEDGWTLVEDAGRGWRRVVPSPEPRAIVESAAIRDLITNGYIVICVGGGGIPVIEKDGRLEGIAAVIDKDYASALLATEIKADMLVISTGVSKVAINFGQPDQKELDLLTVPEAEAYLEAGHFPPGNMGPKIMAILRYLRNNGGQGIITSPEAIVAAVAGKAGTRIVP
ncbi:MAG: carbamate kinase [Thermoanaerobacteraceae bacterium]|uniref:carbamate kinase n=1 Tax=Thermanaeromonas sp. C210 TaxID=2731925 RepID=UPI00155CB1FD|nr:carbamate kinase [Thermanaeromonas sp. C210]MBE3581307.1 carbamate kinase [Thermoanaerobacteraceae bacterium]GFN23685.1 carbamate kinase [Thermanaeromonas sp. C210]